MTAHSPAWFLRAPLLAPLVTGALLLCAALTDALSENKKS